MDNNALLILILFIAIFIIIKEFNSSRTAINYSNITVNTELLSLYNEFKNKKIAIKDDFNYYNKYSYNDDDLKKAYLDIKAHMGIKTPTILNIIEYSEKNNNHSNYKNKGGFYENAPLGYKAINVVIQPYFNFLTCLAVIAHELSHCYMDEYNLKIDDEQKNERKTDLVSIFLGFGKVFKETYGTKEIRKDNLLFTYSVGYLDFEEVSFAYHKIISLTKKNSKNTKKNKKNVVKEEKIETNLITKNKLLNIVYSEFNNNSQKILKVKNIEFEDFHTFFNMNQEDDLKFNISEINKKVELMLAESKENFELEQMIEDKIKKIEFYNSKMNKYLKK